MSSLTKQQIETCASLLKKLKPGFLPLDIFNQIARLVRLPMVVLVPIKFEGKTTLIRLLRRDPNDQFNPGKWHLPGTALRSTDSIESAISRLEDEEILTLDLNTPKYRGFLLHTSKRGPEVVFTYTMENCTFRRSSKAAWFPIDKLPDDLIESEKDAINLIKSTS